MAVARRAGVGVFLIGLGGAVYLLGNGRIMGASGIIGGLVDGSGRSTAAERIAFLLGVLIMPVVLTPPPRKKKPSST